MIRAFTRKFFTVKEKHEPLLSNKKTVLQKGYIDKKFGSYLPYIYSSVELFTDKTIQNNVIKAIGDGIFGMDAETIVFAGMASAHMELGEKMRIKYISNGISEEGFKKDLQSILDSHNPQDVGKTISGLLEH